MAEPIEADQREPLLRRREASDYLHETWGLPRSPRTLANIASSSSDGPRFKIAGAVPLYPKSALDAYAKRVISEQTFASTAEAKAARRAASTNSEAA